MLYIYVYIYKQYIYTYIYCLYIHCINKGCRFEKLIRNNIQVLPTDTVAQRVEHRRDKPKTWVQILARVIFLFCSVAFFLSMLSRRSVGRSNFDKGLLKLNNDIYIYIEIMKKYARDTLIPTSLLINTTFRSS